VEYLKFNKNEYNKILTIRIVLIGIAVIIFDLGVYRIVKEIKNALQQAVIKQKGGGYP